MPAISVLIPVHNRAHLIRDAIGSVLAQSFGDFELVVIDDGSTDNSVVVVEAIGDPRIRIVRHERNRGIPAARNTGLDHATGEFIAWLDSDDVARPTRLEEQLAYLRAHPGIAMVGCAAGKIGPEGRRKRGIRVPPLEPGDIQAWLLFRSAFQQSSVFGRAAVLKEARYGPDFPVCEDLDVFLRLSRSHRLANLPRVLIDRRVHPDQTVRRRQGAIRERKMALYAAPLAAIGMDVRDENLGRHVLLGKTALEGVELPPDFLPWADDWLRTLRARNDETQILDAGGLVFATSWFWLLACRVAAEAVGRGAAARAFLASPLSRGLAGSHGRRWLGRALPLLVRR